MGRAVAAVGRRQEIGAASPCLPPRDLTLPSSGRVPAGFARFHTPLMSNVSSRVVQPLHGKVSGKAEAVGT
jgi:hypothetical protein